MDWDTRIKIYERATGKLKGCMSKDDKRTYVEVEKEFSTVLTPLEKSIFYSEQERMCKLTDEIIAELKADGEW